MEAGVATGLSGGRGTGMASLGDGWDEGGLGQALGWHDVAS